jgi:hypothetical protein
MSVEKGAGRSDGEGGRVKEADPARGASFGCGEGRGANCPKVGGEVLAFSVPLLWILVMFLDR